MISNSKYYDENAIYITQNDCKLKHAYAISFLQNFFISQDMHSEKAMNSLEKKIKLADQDYIIFFSLIKDEQENTEKLIADLTANAPCFIMLDLGNQHQPMSTYLVFFAQSKIAIISKILDQHYYTTLAISHYFIQKKQKGTKQIDMLTNTEDEEKAEKKANIVEEKRKGTKNQIIFSEIINSNIMCKSNNIYTYPPQERLKIKKHNPKATIVTDRETWEKQGFTIINNDYIELESENTVKTLFDQTQVERNKGALIEKNVSNLSDIFIEKPQHNIYSNKNNLSDANKSMTEKDMQTILETTITQYKKQYPTVDALELNTVNHKNKFELIDSLSLFFPVLIQSLNENTPLKEQLNDPVMDVKTSTLLSALSKNILKMNMMNENDAQHQSLKKENIAIINDLDMSKGSIYLTIIANLVDTIKTTIGHEVDSYELRKESKKQTAIELLSTMTKEDKKILIENIESLNTKIDIDKLHMDDLTESDLTIEESEIIIDTFEFLESQALENNIDF